MQRIRHLVLILATLASISTLAVAPVAAEGGSGSGSGSGDGSSTATVTDDHGTVSGTPTETEHTTSPEPAEPISTEPKVESSRIEQFRQEAEQELQSKRHDKKTELGEEARQKACMAHQNEIDTRTSNYAAAAQKHLDTFTSILTNVENFYTNKKLSVANYDALLATATAKQTTAQQAVDALKSLDTKIDCTQPDPGQTVATLQSAVKDTRGALQDYRAAIRALAQAIKSVVETNQSTTTTQTTTGENQ